MILYANSAPDKSSFTKKIYNTCPHKTRQINPLKTMRQHRALVMRTLENKTNSIRVVTRHFLHIIWRTNSFLENDATNESLWSRKHKILISLLLMIFFIGIMTRLHGFSISLWHAVIDGSPQTEVVLGTAQPIRSDDWVASIPQFLAQRAVDPPFPEVNPVIGLGQSMTLLNDIPILSPILLFRPGSWGFLLNSDIGLSWLWWSRVLGLFYAVFLFVLLLSNNRFWVSLLSATVFIWSPFVQFWSFNNAALFTFTFLILIGLFWLLNAGSRFRAYASGIFLGWTGTAFILTIYPAYQVPLAYIIIFFFIGLLIKTQRDHRMQVLLLSRGLFASICIIVIAILLFIESSWETIEMVSKTVYPGRRLVTGGGYKLLNLYDTLLLQTSTTNWDLLSNICESSEFYYIAPLAIFAALFTKKLRLSLLRDPIAWMLAVTTAIFMIWMMVGLPPALAKATLLAYVPGQRMHAGLGVLNIAWLAIIFGLNSNASIHPQWKVIALGTSIWLVLIAFGFRQVAGAHNGTLAWPIIIGVLWSISAALLLNMRVKGFVLVSIIGLILSINFNPLTRGGTQFLYSNPLSQAIVNIGRTDPYARWVVMDDLILSNLPRILGVACINGVHYHPQDDLWRVFDPSGSHKNIYNRYAHVVMKSSEGDPSFNNPQPDVVVLSVSPTHDGFAALNVRYFIASVDDPFFVCMDFEKIFQHAQIAIYRRRTRPVSHTSDQPTRGRIVRPP